MSCRKSVVSLSESDFDDKSSKVVFTLANVDLNCQIGVESYYLSWW